MSFYFMLDVIRTLTYGSAASFKADELAFPLSCGTLVHEAYQQLFVDEPWQPNPRLGSDGLLLLFMILAEVIMVQTTLGAVCLEQAYLCRTDASTMLNLDNAFAKGHKYDGETTHVYCNPYLPGSLMAEYQNATRELSMSIERWHHAYQSDTETAHVGKQDQGALMALYHFSRLMLSTGPGLFAFIRRAGCLVSDHFGSHSPLHVADLPTIPEASIRIAWDVIDNVELVQQDDQTKITPLWFPVAAFYTGMLAWILVQNTSRLDGATGSSDAKRLLRACQGVLKDMSWPCATQYVDMLRALQLEG
jgi:hypothetical protein